MSAARVIEIRSYKLKPGTGAMFHSLVSETSIPLMQAAGMIVVAYGQSLHDPDHYYLGQGLADTMPRAARADAGRTS